MVRRAFLLAILSIGACGGLRAQDAYRAHGPTWGMTDSDYAPPPDYESCVPLRRNFGAVNLNPQRVTRRPSPALLFRGGGWGWGWGSPWGWGVPWGWGWGSPWGWGWGFGPRWGVGFGGWGVPWWGVGFNTWSYRFGFAGGGGIGGPLLSPTEGWTPPATIHHDGWYVGPQGLARRVDDRRPPRENLPLATYEGCHYW